MRGACDPTCSNWCSCTAGAAADNTTWVQASGVVATGTVVGNSSEPSAAACAAACAAAAKCSVFNYCAVGGTICL